MGKELENINWDLEFPPVPDCVHEALMQAKNIVLHKPEEKKKKTSVRKTILLVACLTLFSGLTVFAAGSLWQQRMEAMNRKEVEQYFLSIAESEAPAFRYSRGLTEKERKALEEMGLLYEEQGVFPEGCITMLSATEDYKGKGVGYHPSSGTFFLPQKELKEEELLQIVDFYHKTDYAVQKVAALTQQEETEQPVKDYSTEGPSIISEYVPLNDAVAFREITISSSESPQKIAAGTEFLYLGYKDKIVRMPMETEDTELICILGENEYLFALDADKEDNLYVSVREYIQETGSYENRLWKLDRTGKRMTEYDVANAVSEDGVCLADVTACKMVPDKDGRLYVKDFWGDGLCVYIFAEDGTFEEAIVDRKVKVHGKGSMYMDPDGSLYVLGQEDIVKLDTAKRCVAERYPYATDEMYAARDLLYPEVTGGFYVFSYDGLFITSPKEQTTKRVLAPYESDVFAEGGMAYAISKDTFVVANFAKQDLKVTYLRLTE